MSDLLLANEKIKHPHLKTMRSKFSLKKIDLNDSESLTKKMKSRI